MKHWRTRPLRHALNDNAAIFLGERRTARVVVAPPRDLFSRRRQNHCLKFSGFRIPNNCSCLPVGGAGRWWLLLSPTRPPRGMEQISAHFFSFESTLFHSRLRDESQYSRLYIALCNHSSTLLSPNIIIRSRMLTSKRQLTAVLALLVARQGQGFLVQRTPHFAARALFSTTSDDVASMRAGEIKKELESYGISTKSFLEKTELMDALIKARADGLTPKKSTSTTSTSSSASTSDSSSSSSSSSTASREEQLQKELEKCEAMKASELKKELEELGISTKSFFEKSEFAKALAEARVDGVKQTENYAEYKNVEVLTDDSGPRQKRSQETKQTAPQQSRGGGGDPWADMMNDVMGGGGNPFGGSGKGTSPFGDLGQMGGMGGIADMLKNMGGMGGAGGANPFGGGMGGMGDAMGKAQEMMQNPKVREIVAKARSNPKVMAAVTECMSNPAAFAKYQNDPEVSELINELKKYMV